MSTGNQAGTLEAVAVQVAVLLHPLTDRLAQGEILALLGELGYGLPPELAADPAMTTALEATAAAGQDLAAAAGAVVDASDARDSAGLAVAVGDLVAAIVGLIDALENLAPPLANAAGALTDLTPGEIAELVAEFGRHALEHSVVSALEDNVAEIAGVLDLAGVIERTDERLDSTDPLRPPFTRKRLRLDRLPRLLTEPAVLARELYGWGTPSFDGEALFSRLASILSRTGFPAFFDRAAVPPVLELVVADARVAPANPEPGIALRLHAPPGEEFQQDLGEGLRANAAVRVRGPEGCEWVWTPDGRARLSAPGGATTEGEVRLRFDYDAEDEPFLVVGEQGGTRIQIHRAWVEAVVSLVWAPAEGASLGTLSIAGAIERGEIVAAPPSGDGFLGSILPAEGGGSDFSLAGGLDRSGFFLRGGAGLAITIPVHRELGPVHFEGVLLSLRADGGALVAEIGAALAVRLGPVLVSLDRVGLRVGAAFPAEGGNLGPVELGVRFLPPSSAGVRIDAGPVTGGGFLGYDEATGRYFGALELEVYDVAVKAFGFLDTRLPGGVPAYSFVIIVSTEFTPIPIGFGFTLNGVGGLAGIHRRLAVDVFRERLGQGTLDRVLFPQNPIQDAPQIVTDLQAVLPPAANRYVFGPMAIIAWGSPALLEGKLGVLLEVPDPVRLVLLGQFQVVLPRKDHALITLNLDLVGELEPARQRLALDGRLHDSDVVGFPIEGDLAARAVGGINGSLALSIGGFHPSFTPPAGFPSLRRITVPIGIDDDPRITLEGYLALTANTLQVGALATLYASAGWFNITGHVGFDALFTFLPFSFVTDFSAKVALNKGDTQIAAIQLEATISGLTPWHVAGEACLEIRWFPDICVGFSATFGLDLEVLLPILDPFPLLRQAVENPESWSGDRPPGVFRAATTAPGGAARGLLDPAQGALLRQTVVPLGRRITRFGGSQPPGGAVRFDAAIVSVAGAPDPGSTPVLDLFAPGQFEDLSDDQKLSRPDFERMGAGLTVGRDAVALGRPVSVVVEYETRIIDSAFETRRHGSYHPTRDLLLAAAALGSAATSPLRRSGPAKFAPPPAQRPMASLDEERFVVVSTADLSERGDVVLPAGKGAAFQALEVYLSSHPEERGRLDVVSRDELVEAT